MAGSIPLFQQVEIPGWNALTAGSFDASVNLNANDPLSHVAYSLGALDAYYSPQANRRPGAVNVTDATDCPQGRNILGGCGPIVGSGGMSSDPGGAGIGGSIVDSVIGSPTVKDATKRVGLAILAVVLLALAIWKL